MSDIKLTEILHKVQALPRSEKNKFASYKSRAIKKKMTEEQAIEKAAEQMGLRKIEVLPTLDVNANKGLETANSELPTHTPPLAIIANKMPTDDPVPTPSANKVLAGNERLPTPTGKVISFQKYQRPGSPLYAAMDNGVSKKQTNHNQTQSPIEEVRPSVKAIPFLWLKAFVYGTAFLICTSALTYFSAKAGGGDTYAWFWAVITECFGAAFLIHPAKNWLQKSLFWSIGLLCLTLGYAVMHTGVAKETATTLAVGVAGSSSVKDIEELIELKKKSISSDEKTRDDLASNRISKKQELQIAIDRKANELAGLQAQKQLAQQESLDMAPAQITTQWGYVEWVRRIVLILINVVTGHGAFAAFTMLFRKPELYSAPGIQLY